jgi:hypothetical protein
MRRIDSDRLVLPSIAQTAGAALTGLSRADPRLPRVAELLQQDPLIAPQLLRLSRSAIYGSSRAPRTIQQAITWMGMVRLRTVLLELSAHRAFQSPRAGVGDAFRGLWSTRSRWPTWRGSCVARCAIRWSLTRSTSAASSTTSASRWSASCSSRPRRCSGAASRSTVRPGSRSSAAPIATSRCGSPASGSSVKDLQQIIADSGEYRDGATAANIVCLANAMAKHAGKAVGPIDRIRSSA